MKVLNSRIYTPSLTNQGSRAKREVLQKIWLPLLILTELISAGFISADNPRLVINEIAWMGSAHSYADEWIELYNCSPYDISVEGWILKARDGSPNIRLQGIVPSKGFYLLERTDDETLPDITADLIYSGALGNEGETLELYDNFENLVDEVSCSSGWFKGDNKSKKTMERKDVQKGETSAEGWQTSEIIGGTPKQKNSAPVQKLEILKNQEENLKKDKAVALPLKKESSSFKYLIPALLCAFFSSIMVLILKKTVKKVYNNRI